MTPLQYAILHHTGISEPHFDLLFETLPGSELAAWRSPVWPIETNTSVVRLQDHRRIYLEFEGELTHRRGNVCGVARGTCTVEVGENSVWTIRLLTGSPRLTLCLRQIDGEQWEATTGLTAS
jgi:hypothetical protein